MGQAISREFCLELASGILEVAREVGGFVRLDMEGSSLTQDTIEIFRELRKRYDNVGIVLQAYLHRTGDDVKEAVGRRDRVRLCKGAYKEPPEIAFQKKADVNANFVKLMRILLKSGTYHGIATHDPKMIDATLAFAKAENIAPDKFEFHILYGVRSDLQQQLVKDGWRMRVYIPFGTEWYPYLMRRLAERPANAIFILKNLFRQ